MNKLRKSMVDIRHMVADRPYPNPLPDELADHHFYIFDSGHCIMCIPRGFWEYLKKHPSESADDYECPVPVLAVMRNGYKRIGDYIITNVDYSNNYGIVCTSLDYEY